MKNTNVTQDGANVAHMWILNGITVLVQRGYAYVSFEWNECIYKLRNILVEEVYLPK